MLLLETCCKYACLYYVKNVVLVSRPTSFVQLIVLKSSIFKGEATCIFNPKAFFEISLKTSMVLDASWNKWKPSESSRMSKNYL